MTLQSAPAQTTLKALAAAVRAIRCDGQTHIWLHPGHATPTPGQPCICGQARWGEEVPA